MGIEICETFHWDSPSNIEEYIEETGYAGHDDLPAEVLLFNGKPGRCTSHSVKTCGKQYIDEVFFFWNIVQRTLPNANVVTFVKSGIIVIHALLPT